MEEGFMKTIKVGVIGSGYWGPNLIRNFHEIPEADLKMVCDLREDRLETVRKRYPGLRTSPDYKDMLNSDVEAVVVATPISTHYAIVKDCLLAGKHVLCEKPLCETSQTATELTQIAQEKKLILMVGNVFLFNPGIVKLKEIVESGELGKIDYLSSIRTNLGPIRSDVNAAYDLATHDITIFNWLMNSEPEVISAMGGSFLQPGIEDVVFISMKYPGNVIANIHASWLNPKKVRQITAIGTQKMVTWDDLEMNMPIAIYDKGVNTTQEQGDYGEFLRIAMWEGDVRLPKIKADEPLKAEGRYFLESINKGRIERSDGVFSVGVVKVLEAVSSSLKLGGDHVQVAV
jgi:predicted dehydrogenase